MCDAPEAGSIGADDLFIHAIPQALQKDLVAVRGPLKQSARIRFKVNDGCQVNRTEIESFVLAREAKKSACNYEYLFSVGRNDRRYVRNSAACRNCGEFLFELFPRDNDVRP